jgi:two-component system, chemotaxis family, sensor kinase CheA
MDSLASKHKIFDSHWLNLKTPQERQRYLIDKMQGLKPAVLFVDDQHDVLEAVKNQFEELGLECLPFLETQEAEDCLNKNKSRLVLILSDFKMNHMSGFEWREQTLPLNHEVPFVILSGYVDREMALKGMALKIDAFLEKPSSLDSLRDVLQNNCDLYASRLSESHELLSSFLDDAGEILEQIESIFLELENDPNDKDLLNRAYGLLHTMKGNAGFFEPRTLHEFTHKFEDQIKAVQNSEQRLDSVRLSTWLKALDTLKMLAQEFRDFSHQNHLLADLLKVFERDSSAAATDEREPSASPEAQEKKEQKSKDNEIRVSMSLLDEFMQVSGEMTVIRNMINKSAQALERRYSSDKDVQLLIELLYEMHKINSDVQNKINDLRRVSVQNFIRPLMRTARDSARALGKNVDIKVDGQELRVDNAIAEVLSRSLIHLVRNSLDHGIENSEDRSRSNKSPKGLLALRFSEQDDNVEVEITDDGRGLDISRIRQKVIDQGLRSPDEVARMSDEELFPMIFEAGFSTAQVTTEFSGRGVGMSMVKDSIQAMGGQIQISSKAGQGSTFGVRIPIPKSALIESCLFVGLGERTYGVPQSHVLKVLQFDHLHTQDYLMSHGQHFYRFADQLLPVFAFHKNQLVTSGYWLILKSETGPFVMQVEKIFDVEDSVIKTFQAETLKTLKIYKGVTFLGDGSVGLVFHPDHIVEHFALHTTSLALKEDEEAVHETKESKHSRYLSFKVRAGHNAEDALFAFTEGEILRIEKFALEHIQLSAGRAVMPYRGSLMELVDFASVLGQKQKGTLNEAHYAQESLNVILLNGLGFTVGLVVDEIVDLELLPQQLHEATLKLNFCQGYLLKPDGRAINKLNGPELVDYLRAEDVTSLDAAAEKPLARVA